MRTRKRIETGKEEFPLATMIDVVFLLLIYFIVTQKPIVEETLMNTSLPTGPETTIPRTEIPCQIEVPSTDDNYYSIMGTVVKEKEMVQYLKTISAGDCKTPILIRCSNKSRHGKLIKLLDDCSNAGLKNLNIIETSE